MLPLFGHGKGKKRGDKRQCTVSDCFRGRDVDATFMSNAEKEAAIEASLTTPYRRGSWTTDTTVPTAPAAGTEVAMGAATGSSPPGNPAREKSDEWWALRQRLFFFYAHYAPHKLPKIDAILHAFSGRERMMIRELVRKYGPEPPLPSPPPLPLAMTRSTVECLRAQPPTLLQDDVGQKSQLHLQAKPA